MKANKKGFVQMPAQTLNALKNMLFANDGDGVDLSNIINDQSLRGLVKIGNKLVGNLLDK